MTAREAIDKRRQRGQASVSTASKRSMAHEAGVREALDNDPGRWTWCAACLTVYDDYGVPVNPIPDLRHVY